MKITKALFFELMYDFQSARWNEFELPKLSLRELMALAKLLGCPSCGSKETVIVRLLAQRELRLKLARFTDNPEELANSYKRESLRDMCREAGIWRSGNKRALSAGLLNWRDRCRARGQASLAQMQSLAKEPPPQLSSASKFCPDRRASDQGRKLRNRGETNCSQYTYNIFQRFNYCSPFPRART